MLSSGNALPAATVIGTGGRVPPNTVIEDDATGNVEAPGVLFDPAEDGLDFYESMEGMLVQMNDLRRDELHVHELRRDLRRRRQRRERDDDDAARRPRDRPR